MNKSFYIFFIMDEVVVTKQSVPTTTRMRFYFVRHGESITNAKGLFCGSMNSPLTELGFAQAERAADFLHDTPIDWLATSPMVRAKATADIIAARHNLNLIIDPRLAEHAKGQLEGTPHHKVESRDWDSVPGAEAMQQLYDRVNASLVDLSHLDGTGLIVSHAGVARAIQAIRDGVPARDLYSLKKAGNAEPYFVDIAI
jgi:broad specificity phosphatase PhoE